MIDFLKEHFPVLITGLLGLGAWWNEKRKIKNAEKDAFAQMQAAYDTFAKDMKVNYDELKKDYHEVKAKVALLELEVVQWKTKYTALKAEMNNLEQGVQTTPNNGKQ